MYAQNHGPQSPGLSNNPFLSDPSDAHQRFPDLTSSAASSFGANPQQGYSPAGQQAQQGYGGSYGGYNNASESISMFYAMQYHAQDARRSRSPAIAHIHVL